MPDKFRFFLVLGIVIFPFFATAQVYHIDISGTIDGGLPPYLERVINEAEAANAKAILLEVNTFGGRVDAATEIKDLLLNTELKSIAYVNKRAISAGAFISLACNTIGMAPGSSMGAATVVDQEGNKGSEKQISYFRTEMGATAEHRGRSRQIAEGMVDEDVIVEGLSEKGKLITLSADEAVKWEMADLVAPTLSALLDSLELGEEIVIYSETNWAENVVRFLTGPVISSFLISLGFLGLFFELQSPGWGVAGSFGLICLILFFGSQYIINLASSLEIVLFFIGVILLVVELFVLPGFGIAGIAGITCMVASIYLSLLGSWDSVTAPDLGNAATRLAGALFITVAGVTLMFKYGPKTKMWQRLTLGGEQRVDEGYIATKDYSQYVGLTGKALTPLRPAGTGLIGNNRLDVVSEGGFIDQDVPIVVIRTEGYRLIVREDTETASEDTETAS